MFSIKKGKKEIDWRLECGFTLDKAGHKCAQIRIPHIAERLLEQLGDHALNILSSWTSARWRSINW